MSVPNMHRTPFFVIAPSALRYNSSNTAPKCRVQQLRHSPHLCGTTAQTQHLHCIRLSIIQRCPIIMSHLAMGIVLRKMLSIICIVQIPQGVLTPINLLTVSYADGLCSCMCSPSLTETPLMICDCRWEDVHRL